MEKKLFEVLTLCPTPLTGNVYEVGQKLLPVTLVCVFTVAMHTIFLTRQIQSNGNLRFTLQIHVTSMYFAAFFFSDFPFDVFNYLFCAFM